MADEAKARPFWQHYEAQDVIEAMVMFEAGLPKLQRLRILATHDEPDGRMGIEVHSIACWSSSVARPRWPIPVGMFSRSIAVLPAPSGSLPSAFSRSTPRLRAARSTDRWDELPEESGHFIPPRSAPAEVRDRFVEIPAVAFYTEKTGHFEADPPLRDALGDLCLQHWRKKSHQDTLMHAVNTPIMTAMMNRADFEGANRPVTTRTRPTTRASSRWAHTRSCSPVARVATSNGSSMAAYRFPLGARTW